MRSSKNYIPSLTYIFNSDVKGLDIIRVRGHHLLFSQKVETELTNDIMLFSFIGVIFSWVIIIPAVDNTSCVRLCIEAGLTESDYILLTKYNNIYTCMGNRCCSLHVYYVGAAETNKQMVKQLTL